MKSKTEKWIFWVSVVVYLILTISLASLKAIDPNVRGAILAIMILLPIFWLVISIDSVKPNEKAYLYILDRPQKRIKKSGLTLVPFGIGYLVKFPTNIQTAKLYPEDVMIAATKGSEEESQPITVFVQQPFTFKDIQKVYKNLGAKNTKEIMDILFGKEELFQDKEPDDVKEDENLWHGGLAGEKIAAIVRAYVASDEIPTLDAAYKMRVALGEEISKKLIAELPRSLYGITWQPTIIYDVRAREEILKARTAKAKAAIARDMAKIDAEKTVEIAAGEAEAISFKGLGEAEAEKAKGLARAEVEKAIGFAGADVTKKQLMARLEVVREATGGSGDLSQNEAARSLAILLFGSDLAKEMKGMGEFKVFMAPNLEGLLGSVFGGNKTAKTENLLQAFMSMNPASQEQLGQELKKLLGGKS
jgi:hypothetical protein